MSGLAVIHNADRGPIAESDLLALLKEIEGRGTEQFTWLSAGIAMGQRLLPTTPEALHEHLPLEVLGGRFQVVMDGRLDNRSDVIGLLGLGRPMSRVLSDQDLVALAYGKWGEDCANHLVGDFAFVVWDDLEQCLFGARDQRGFRPLVYAWAGRRLLIGSEPVQLLRQGPVSAEVHHSYLARYLIGLPPRPGTTPYAAISELPAGHWLKVSGDRIHVQQYWKFSQRPQLRYRRQEEYVEHFASIFSQAVAAATRTIETPGLLLSGGVDSSCVAAEAVKTALDLRAFVAYVDGFQGMDERAFARPVAEALGIPLQDFDASDCWSLSSQYLSDADFDQPEHPMQSALMVKSARLAAAADVNVLIDGVGGDEFFTGAGSLASLVASGHLLEAERRIAAGGQPLLSVLKEDVLKPLLPYKLRLHSRRIRGKPDQPVLPEWVDADSLPEGVVDSPELAPSHVSAWHAQALRQQIWDVLQSVTLPHIAWRARRAYLPNGIEHRSPLWDLRVIEFFLQTPIWVHANAVHGKAILRAHMKDYVPAPVLQREDKALFDDMLRKAIVDEEVSRVQEALFCSPLADLPYIRCGELDGEFRRFAARDHPWWLPLWRAITAGLWLQSDRAKVFRDPVVEGVAR